MNTRNVVLALLFGIACLADLSPLGGQMQAPAGMTTSIFVECPESGRVQLDLTYGEKTTIDAEPQNLPPGRAAPIPVWANFVTSSAAAQAVSITAPEGLQAIGGQRALVVRGEQAGSDTPWAIAIPWVSAVMRGSIVRERCLSPDEAALVFGDRTSEAAIRALQQRLVDRGHDIGPADGRMGPRTLRELDRFRTEFGIPTGPTLDDETVVALVSGR